MLAEARHLMKSPSKTRSTVRAGLILTALATVLVAAAPDGGVAPPFSDLADLPSPAAAGSGQPQLASAADGAVVMSWIEPSRTGHSLRVAELRGQAWTPASTVVEGSDFFVNWADVPSVFPLRDGRLAAHWLFTSGANKYAYHVGVRLSSADRRSWSGTIVPHRDTSPTEHGFASLYDAPEGGLGLAWLDGRAMAGHDPSGGDHGAAKGSMSLRSTVVGAGNRPGAELLVDARVCDCCPTAAVRTDRGILLAYRDRTQTEVRDISVARLEQGTWSAPVAVHRDGWQISGCPVNGPALAADRLRVALAWFTAEGNDARTLVAFSPDGGASFGKPIRADDGVSLGRVSVALTDEGSAIVSWIEYAEGRSEWRARRVRPDGTRADSMRITAMSGDRASGYPRIARSGSTLVFAWTSTGGQPGVRTARARIP
jgi:hypothetical protein